MNQNIPFNRPSYIIEIYEGVISDLAKRYHLLIDIKIACHHRFT